MKKIINLAIIAIFGLMLAACETAEVSTIGSSGIIEAVQVTISSQFPGSVTEIFVSEGDSVIEGQNLIRIEDQFLETQITQAQLAYNVAQSGQISAIANLALSNAALDAANAVYDSVFYQYEMVLMASRLTEFPERIYVWSEPHIAEFDLPSWYFSKPEDIQAAEIEVETALNDLEIKGAQLKAIIDKSENVELKIAEIALSGARAKYIVILNIYQNYQGIPDNLNISNELLERYNEALDELENAQELYDSIISELEDNEILDARIELSVAQQLYESALDYLASLMTGAESPQVLSAHGLVSQSEAVISQAEAGVSLAEANFEQTNLAIELADANLQLLEIQKESMTIKAPSDGVILVSSYEIGELVAPGQILMTLGKLDQLSVTVFIPEDQYGTISLGDTASLTTDSYPDKAFAGTVTFISDRAEFTPTNVQTEEERRTTVYAIKLTINTDTVQLIPGMPVQVAFD